MMTFPMMLESGTLQLLRSLWKPRRIQSLIWSSKAMLYGECCGLLLFSSQGSSHIKEMSKDVTYSFGDFSCCLMREKASRWRPPSGNSVS